MSKGGGSTQKVKQTSKPWGPAQPYALDALGQAQNLYANYRPQAYPGSTVADLSPQTQAALQAMWDRASTGSPLTSQAQNLTSQVLAGGGGVPQQAFDFLSGMTGGGYTNPATGFALGDIASSWQDNPALRFMTQEASGANVGRNPYLDETYNRAAGALTRNWNNIQAPTIDAGVDLHGRVGSRSQAGAYDDSLYGLGNAMAGLGNQIYGGAYTTDRANQMTGMADLASTYANQQAAQRAATGAYGGMFNQDIANRMATAQSLGNLGISDTAQRLGAASGAPALAESDYTDIMKMLATGGALDARSQQQLQGLIDSWNQQQQTPYTALQNYASTISPFMFSNQTTSQPAGSNVAGLIGGLSGLGSFATGLGSLFATPAGGTSAAATMLPFLFA